MLYEYSQNLRKSFELLGTFLYEFGKCQKRSCRFKFLFKRFWNIRRSAGDDSNTEKQLNTTKLRPLLLIGCIFHVRTTLLLRLLKLTNTCRGVTYVNIVLILFCFVLFCFVSLNVFAGLRCALPNSQSVFGATRSKSTENEQRYNRSHWVSQLVP